MSSTALVTGGAGFLGSHLCQQLLAVGWQVHATSRRKVDSVDDRITFHKADLAEFDVAQDIVHSVKPDAVFHLAGAVSAAACVDLVLPTHRSHVISSLNLLSIATQNMMGRLVLVGSLMEPIGDIRDAIPSSPYAAAKLAVTYYGRMFHRLYDSPVVVVRPFMTFGPGQGDDKILPYVIRSLSVRKTPRLSSGNWQTDWIFVDDVVDGMLLAATCPDIFGAEIDLGCGKLHSVKDMVMRIFHLMDSSTLPQFGLLADRPSEPVRTADVARAKELIGWVPRVDLDDGLRRTIAWYQRFQ